MGDFDAENAFLRSMQEDDTGTPSPTVPAVNLLNKQPRKIGGFIDDDDEDEEDMTAMRSHTASGRAPLIVDRATSNTPQRVSDSVVPFSDVSIQTASQNQDRSQSAVSHTSTNGIPHVTAVPKSGTVTGHPDITKPTQDAVVSASSSSVQIDASTVSLPKTRLPHDRVGVLEDRIKDDPRGDLDAWLSLIGEQRKRNRLDDARNTYDRFLEVFPTAAEQWVAYVSMELEHNEFFRVEQIFNKSLLNVPNVQLWSIYLNYVRRRNNLTADASGNARQVINQTYDFVLQNVGIDKDSGPLWQDYIQFLRTGPGNVGGTGWQDQQKMDSLRKAYQRAICIPTQAVNNLWKEYDSLEMGLNKITGRKFLQEKSPSYMTARSSNTALQNLTRELNRTTLPSLPPAFGFDGEAEYREQVELWKNWIEWEKEDPLVLKEEDEAAYKARILFVYKQALMALRFWPEMWFEAAQFCFAHGLETEGNNFMAQGTTANPESCLLAFQRADRIESTTTNEEGDEAMLRRGKAVREPYDKVLDALYDVITKVKEREVQAIARIKQSSTSSASTTMPDALDADDDDDADENKPKAEAHQRLQIEAVQRGNAAQIKLLGRTVSFVWIALMRAMRRVQGKGKVGDAIGGSRQIFTDARARGRLTSDVYVASALIEYHCYKDVAATKIFERGMKLFKDDEQFALEYLKHLVAINDITNARAVFETTVARLTTKSETVLKAKPLFQYFHDFESRYGELSQVTKLEHRMLELFPDDSQLQLFSQRSISQGFDPTAVRPLVSPNQTRAGPMLSIEKAPSIQNSPRPSVVQVAQITNSPKRPFDDSDNESVAPPRKVVRGESPLKGAAGRRVDAAQKRTNLRNEVQQNSLASRTGSSLPQPPPLLPSGILHLLSIIPHANTYNATRLSPERMIDLVRGTDLSRYQPRQPGVPSAQAASSQYNYGQTTPFGFGG